MQRRIQDAGKLADLAMYEYRCHFLDPVDFHADIQDIVPALQACAKWGNIGDQEQIHEACKTVGRGFESNLIPEMIDRSHLFPSNVIEVGDPIGEP
jgi:hypothetical protein